MSYFPDSVYEDIRADPTRIVSYFEFYKSQFIADLGMPEISENALKAAFCAIVAYGLADYGNDPATRDLATLLSSPTLSCVGYVELTWRLIELFGISTEEQVAAGWYDGAVGNHSQLLVSSEGTYLLLDPTIGLIVYGVTFEGLIEGFQFSDYASFYDRDDISYFNELVINAIVTGLYDISDVMYRIPGFDNWINNYFEYVGLYLDNGNNSQTIVGYIYDDVLDAGSGDDFIYGGGGNDSIIGGSGNDYMNGGAGVDQIVFDGSRSQYNITEYGDGKYRITGENNDIITEEFEEIRFSDQIMVLTITKDYYIDAQGAYTWDAYVVNKDWRGDILSIYYMLDGGGKYLYDYDTRDQFAWDRIQSIYDDESRILRYLYEQDDGTSVAYHYDTTNSSSWSRITTYYTANVEPDRHVYDMDDGTYILYQYDNLNVGAWSKTSTFFTSDWKVDRILYNQDDSTSILYQYDLGDASWSRIVTYINPNGAAERILYDYDEGGHSIYTYDENGALLNRVDYDSNWLLI